MHSSETDFQKKSMMEASLYQSVFFDWMETDLGSILRTSLDTFEMQDLLIVITDLWLIWFSKRICLFKLNI